MLEAIGNLKALQATRSGFPVPISRRWFCLKDEPNSLSSHDDELMETRRADVAYQYVREPLRAEEADALSHACETPEEKLITRLLCFAISDANVILLGPPPSFG